MNNLPTANLEAIAGRIHDVLTLKNKARERAFTRSREGIRNAANSIRAVHRGELETAKDLLATTRMLLDEIDEAIEEHPEFRYTGYVDDAQKEYAEAIFTMGLVSGTPLPDPEEVGVSYSAYLNGLGEAAGEMRRHLLDALRRNEVSHCEQVLSAMDDIYNVLITMDSYYRNGDLLDHKVKADEAVARAEQGGLKVDKVLVWRRYPGKYSAATPMVEGRLDADHRARRKNSSALGTEGTAWDVGWAAVFFASDESRWVSGTVLPVDAGLTIAARHAYPEWGV